MMQDINNEYHEISKHIGKIPESLERVRVGNVIFVNNSKCVVTKVEKNTFKAKSLITNREAYFSKNSGFAMLNYKFRATIFEN
ncbi:MAG: hypothetical protein HC906_10585 [Bacteroidales bacterium]|nr:hypothetical protein [Bacteroidales bacterium]